METPPLVVGVKKSSLSSLSKTSLTPCRRLGLCRPSPSSLKKTLLTEVTPSKDCSLVSAPLVQQVTFIEKNLTVSEQEKNKQKIPLKSSDSLNKSPPLKVRRCLTKESSKPTDFLQSDESVLRRTFKFVLSDTTQDSCGGDQHVNNTSKIDIAHSITKRRKLSLNVPSNCSKKEEKNNSGILNASNFASCSSTCASTGQQENSSLHVEPHTIVDSKEEVTDDVIQNLIASLKGKKKRLELLKVQETYAKKHNLEELRAQTEKWTIAGREALRYAKDLAQSSGYSVTIKELMAQHSFPKHLMGYNSEDDDFE